MSWFKKLFIDEAKPTLRRYSESSSVNDLIDGSLTTINISENCAKIRPYAFAECDNLTEVTFNGMPTTIDQSAFLGCDNLITINVPWSEGDITGAPWGAVNATVNYDAGGASPKLGVGVLGKMKLA